MKEGSNEYLAYRIRSALNPVEIFGLSTYRAEEHQWAIEQLAKAWQDYDVDFIRAQLDGLQKLKSNDSRRQRDPRFFLSRAYNFLRRSGTPPLRSDTIRLTNRTWAIARLTQSVPELPLPTYTAEFERKIRLEIDRLPEQKWPRHFQVLALEFSPAKRGPKPKRQ